MPDKRKRRNCTEDHIIKIVPKRGGMTVFEVRPECYRGNHTLRLRISTPTPYMGYLETERNDSGDILIYYRSDLLSFGAQWRVAVALANKEGQ